MLKPLYEALTQRNKELVMKYRDKALGKQLVTNIPTGLKTLDNYGVGEPGILTAVQGHPGDGKSSFVRQLLRGASAGFKPQAYIFEDPEKFFADGFTAKEMGVSSFKLRRFELDPLVAEKSIIAATRNMEWAKDILFQTEKIDSKQLRVQLMDTIVTPKEGEISPTGAVFVDYLQAFDAEDDEKSVERVIARLCWDLMDVAKAKNVAIYAFSQPRGEVELRGRQRYDQWMWRLQKDNKEERPSKGDFLQAVEGYRPGPGDAQWARAISQRAKDILSIFRPGKWLRNLGHTDIEDNLFEIIRVKGNYSPGQDPLRFKWVGESQSIEEREKAKK